VTVADDIGMFVVRASPAAISPATRRALQVRILDALGCAIGALDEPTTGHVRRLVDELGGVPRCTVIGGGRTAPDRAALANGALVRYLDFNDSYLAAGETCHPSDNLAPVLAASEWNSASGRDLLVALAVAYQVQCRLSDRAPLRARGFDHTTQLAVATAAGVSKALGLDAPATANAVAIAATSLTALRVTRTGRLSHWKGLAAPWAAGGATLATFLASEGVTAPSEAFEGTKGFMDTVSGPFSIDWDGDLDAVESTVLKRFNAEVHSQSVIEAVIDLHLATAISIDDVARIEVELFQAGFDIIGGGDEGDKTVVFTKEDADHSLPYLVAVALLDGQVLPAQFRRERIAADDVQALLRRVEVRPAADLTARFPDEHACRVRIGLRSGRVLEQEKSDYEGWWTRPMSWDRVVEKFEALAGRAIEPGRAKDITQAVLDLESIDVTDLMQLLGEGERRWR